MPLSLDPLRGLGTEGLCSRAGRDQPDPCKFEMVVSYTGRDEPDCCTGRDEPFFRRVELVYSFVFTEIDSCGGLSSFKYCKVAGEDCRLLTGSSTRRCTEGLGTSTNFAVDFSEGSQVEAASVGLDLEAAKSSQRRVLKKNYKLATQSYYLPQ